MFRESAASEFRTKTCTPGWAVGSLTPFAAAVTTVTLLIAVVISVAVACVVPAAVIAAVTPPTKNPPKKLSALYDCACWGGK